MIYRNLTREEYLALPGVSNSTLKAFTECPESYSRGIERPRTEAMQFGLDVEDYLRFGCLPDVVCIPDDALAANGHRRGKAWEAFLSANEGKRLLKQHEIDNLYGACERISQQVGEHSDANRALYMRGTEWQVAITWTCPRTGVLCKGLLDVLGHDHVADVKTSDSVDEASFARTAANLKYHWQAFAYMEAAAKLSEQEHPVAIWGRTAPPTFVFVVIQSKPPYRVECYELDERWIEVASEEVTRARKMWAEYEGRPKPWRSPSHGQTRVVQCPGWVRRVAE